MRNPRTVPTMGPWTITLAMVVRPANCHDSMLRAHTARPTRAPTPPAPPARPHRPPHPRAHTARPTRAGRTAIARAIACLFPRERLLPRRAAPAAQGDPGFGEDTVDEPV